MAQSTTLHLRAYSPGEPHPDSNSISLNGSCTQGEAPAAQTLTRGFYRIERPVECEATDSARDNGEGNQVKIH